MMQGDHSCQEILDYFRFEGTYDEHIDYPGQFDPRNGLIKYNEVAFSKNYDYLRAIYEEELFHSKDYNYAKENTPEGILYREYEEWRAQIHLYKNQGLYLKSGLDWAKRINYWGSQAGVYIPEVTVSGVNITTFVSKGWHMIYKISRQW
jgi:hypothetical protein